MTVIAWDGATVAADRLLNSGGSASQITKIYEINDRAIAVCGAAKEAMRVMAWYRLGADPSAYPAPADPAEACWMIEFSPDAAMVYEGPIPYKAYSPCSWGSGRDFAQAAMYMGESSQRAVEVANALCCYCGGGVDVIDLGTLKITRAGAEQ